MHNVRPVGKPGSHSSPRLPYEIDHGASNLYDCAFVFNDLDTISLVCITPFYMPGEMSLPCSFALCSHPPAKASPPDS